MPKLPNPQKESDEWSKFGFALIIILMIGTIFQTIIWIRYHGVFI